MLQMMVPGYHPQFSFFHVGASQNPSNKVPKLVLQIFVTVNFARARPATRVAPCPRGSFCRWAVSQASREARAAREADRPGMRRLGGPLDGRWWRVGSRVNDVNGK